MKQPNEFDRVTRKLTKDQLFGDRYRVHYIGGSHVSTQGFSLEELLAEDLDEIDFITAA